MSVHLFGDSDDFEQGFSLGVVWQLLRQELDHADVVLATSLVARARRLGEAVGYRVAVRKPHGLPGLRHVRFSAVRKGVTDP